VNSWVVGTSRFRAAASELASVVISKYEVVTKMLQSRFGPRANVNRAQNFQDAPINDVAMHEPSSLEENPGASAQRAIRFQPQISNSERTQNMNTSALHLRRMPWTLTSFLACLALCVTLTCPSAQAQTTAATPAARVTQAIDEHQLVRLSGNIHPQAKAQFDQGAIDDSQPATRALILLQRSPEQEAALRQLLDDQQNKASANYHAWLTPAQFGTQFGPADSDVQAVTQWLTSHGFQNIKVGAGKTAIEFSGNVGQMRETFHTDTHKFLIRGETRNANISDPQIPAALAPVISGVVGLTNFRPRAHVHRLGTFRKTKATGEVKPLFAFSPSGGCPPLPICEAVGPGDLAKIYNVPATVIPNGTNVAVPAGQGQTVVVVNDSNINVQDVIDYRSLFGLPAIFTSANVIVNGPDPGLTEDETEADLDTQVAGAVAPNATVLLVVTEQPDSGVGAAGVDLSVLYTINNNIAPVVSKSFGACEADEGNSGNALENALWEQASAQGITGMVSAGDTGAAACDPVSSNLDVAAFGLAVSGDASTPFDVAVGGTDFNQTAANYTNYWSTTNTATTQTSALGYIPEVTWNDSCAEGGINACTTAIINENSAGLTSTGPDLVAGAGGPSNCVNSTVTTENGEEFITCNSGYPKPTWQTGIGVPADGARDLPDVSLFASNGQNGSFYIICEQDANSGTGSSTTSCDLNSPFNDFQGVGGTSASSPAFAAIMALVNQQTGSRQGNANYVLYPLAAAKTCTSAANPANTCVFYDIPAGSNNSVACQGGSFNCSNQSTSPSAYGILVQSDNVTPAFNTTAGYDQATGLGSVNVQNLLTNWTSASFRPTTTTFSLNGGAAVNITHGATVSVSGAVTPTTGTGTPTGFVELVQGTTVPGPIIDTFPLSSTGTYSGTTNMLPGTATSGPYTITAYYGGDGIFAGSTASTTGTVNNVGKEPSVVTVNFVTFPNNTPTLSTAAASLPYGSSYILLIAVTNSSGTLCVPPPFGSSAVGFGAPLPCPTGTVTLSDKGSPLNDFLVPNTSTPTNSAKLNNTGFAEDQPIQLGGGSHSLTATYGGDNSFTANNTSNTLSVTITTAATTTALSASVNSITPGQSVVITAQVVGPSSNGAAPTGTVQFMNGSVALSTPVMCGTPMNFNPNTDAPPSCTASITTMSLSFSTPPAPEQLPRIKTGPMWIAAFVALILFLLALTRVAPEKRRVFACAGLVLFACAAAGIAGCGGGGGGGGGGGHTDSVTAVYSGDANYAPSTAPAIGISVQ